MLRNIYSYAKPYAWGVFGGQKLTFLKKSDFYFQKIAILEYFLRSQNFGVKYKVVPHEKWSLNKKNYPNIMFFKGDRAI